jgi:DNA-binding response OmpR family regulator
MSLSRALKILLVDDTELNLLLLSKFISKQGHTAIQARNGLEAIEKFQSEAPDLVLMDVMMPVMDGFEATAKIRALGGAWIPILFLTAKTGDEDHLKGIQVGGDDFIAKPINLVLLDARIKAVMRIADMQHQILENTHKLEQYHDANEREISLAKHLIDRITQSGKLDQQRIHSFNIPAQDFSGDIFITARTPTDEIHVLLADGTGHGLSAALNVLPVVDIFYSMSNKGFSISSIASELNHKIRYLMPTERFVAATLISFNFSDKTLELWNGGNPAVLFTDQDGHIIRRWESNHPALGIFQSRTSMPAPRCLAGRMSARYFYIRTACLKHWTAKAMNWAWQASSGCWLHSAGRGTMIAMRYSRGNWRAIRRMTTSPWRA